MGVVEAYDDRVSHKGNRVASFDQLLFDHRLLISGYSSTKRSHFIEQVACPETSRRRSRGILYSDLCSLARFFLSWLFNQYIRMLRRRLTSHGRAIVLGIAPFCLFTEHEDKRIRNHLYHLLDAVAIALASSSTLTNTCKKLWS
ncbi:hypothetical protein BHM03_00002644 [Ensete ventricosum]|nr:hypothetical protein BHM03_00002644 [Ensete ventricosum]